MLDAAEDALSFVKNKRRANLDIDRKLVLALVKAIEIVGEAAVKVSADGRSEHPGIPWDKIVSMRNRLIHAYFNIDLDILWQTVNEDIPALIAELEGIGEPGLKRRRSTKND
jgi:uncharacterized protein with HEPN domain